MNTYEVSYKVNLDWTTIKCTNKKEANKVVSELKRSNGVRRIDLWVNKDEDHSTFWQREVVGGVFSPWAQTEY